MPVEVIFPDAINSNAKQIFASGSAIIGVYNLNFLTFTDNSQIVVGNSTLITNIHVLKPSSVSDIYFPVSGDYSPSVRIFIEGEPEIDYTFSQIKVHVLSDSEVEQINDAKLNLELSYAVFVISIIGVVRLVYELFKKKKLSKTIIST